MILLLPRSENGALEPGCEKPGSVFYLFLAVFLV